MFITYKLSAIGIIYIALNLAHFEGLAQAQEEPKNLAKAKLRAAEAAYRGCTAQLGEKANHANMELCYLWSKRILGAQIDLAVGERLKQKALNAAYQNHVNRMGQLGKHITRSVKSGMARENQLAAVEYYELEAQQWLAESQMK